MDAPKLNEPKEKVSLTTRTWIGLILIVLVFGNLSGKKADSATNPLKNSRHKMQQTIDAQAEEIAALKRDLARLSAATTQPATK